MSLAPFESRLQQNISPGSENLLANAQKRWESDRWKFCPSGDKTTDTFLKAVASGDLSQVRSLGVNKKLFSVRDKNRRTALMLAAVGVSKHGDKVFKLVLKNTLSPFLKGIDDRGQNALFYACKSQIPHRIEALLNRGVQVITSRIGPISTDLVAGDHPVFRRIFTAITEATVKAIERDLLVFSIRVILLERENPQYLSSSSLLEHERMRLSSHVGSDIVRLRVNAMKSATLSREKVVDFLFSDPKVRSELTDYLFLQQPTFQDTRAVAQGIRNFYGIEPDRGTTRELIQAMRIITRNAIAMGESMAVKQLRTTAVKKMIGRYFQKHPPATIQEAIDYIRDLHGVRCTAKSVQKFLAHYTRSCLYDILD